MSFRTWLPLLIFPPLAAVAALATAPLIPHDVPAQALTIEPGASLRAVLNQAYDANVLRTPRSTELLARLTKQTNPKVGTYRLPASASDWQLLKLFNRGQIETTSVTVLEGWTALEIAAALEQREIVAAADFLQATTSPRLLDRYGIVATEVEGYLFPETYRFARGLDGETVANVMLKTFFARLPATYATLAEQVNLSVHDAVILASIIQRESYVPSEMPLVSSVYHNRLRLSWPLQADPTLTYRMPGYNGNIQRQHFTTPTPYNTYLNRGLPAGPISNPGSAALLAAVLPAASDYMFFVATGGDGTHDFSRTYPEHQAKVLRFNRFLREQRQNGGAQQR